MRFSLSAPASALILASLVFADAASDVLTLTTATFESTLNPEPLVLVEFFAPWYVPLLITPAHPLIMHSKRCGHCKALAPHYEEAATALKDKNIKLAKVDCVDEADLCQANGVQGYPSAYHEISPILLLLTSFQDSESVP